MLVGTREILSQSYEVHADKYGVFSIHELEEDGGKVLGSGETLDIATAKARQELNKRKIKVSVPFFTKKGERGIAHGLHGRTRQVLVVMDNGSRAPMDEVRVFKGDMPEDKLNEYITKREQIRQLQSETAQIDKQYEIYLDHHVKQAINDTLKDKEKPLSRMKGR